MKKLITMFLLAVPAVAMADYVDVLSAKLKDGCSIATFQQIVADFNATWAQGTDYKAQLLIPVMSEDLHTLYWVGRTTNAEAYGRSLERWVKEANDPNTVTGKLNERMNACVTWGGRAGFITR
jgi:hypothetical protein